MYTVDHKNLHKYELDAIQKFIIAAYDIECFSATNEFPDYMLPSDAII